jgi:Na+/proline symporter
MMAAICGPVFAGILWHGTTKAGALSGFATGAVSFVLVKFGFFDAAWFAGGALEAAAIWLANQAPNPFSCGAIGSIVSIVTVVAVSLVTDRPSAAHLRRVFAN